MQYHQVLTCMDIDMSCCLDVPLCNTSMPLALRQKGKFCSVYNAADALDKLLGHTAMRGRSHPAGQCHDPMWKAQGVRF